MVQGTEGRWWRQDPRHSSWKPSGDRSRCIFCSGECDSVDRNAVLIWLPQKFELIVDAREHRPNAPSQWVRRVFYGQLHYILVVELPTFKSVRSKFELAQPTTYLLARVTPCKTGGVDATKAFASYKTGEEEPDLFIDVRTIHCVVGRIYTRGKWWIVDRSRGAARTVFEADPA